MTVGKITPIFILIALVLTILTISVHPLIVNANITQSNWQLIYHISHCRPDSYGHNVCYSIYIYKFSGYVQNGYYEWYTIYLRDTNDPVNPVSDNEGWTVAGKAGESPTGGGVGIYIYDNYGQFNYDYVMPSSSQASCATEFTDSYSVSASLSEDGPSIKASYGVSTSWQANGVSWSLRDVYPKAYWEFWHCNEPPPTSAELGSAWTFEVAVTYSKNTFPGDLITYTVEVSPSAGFRHWYTSCILFWCWWDWDYSIHYPIPLQISFTNQ